MQILKKKQKQSESRTDATVLSLGREILKTLIDRR